MSTSRRSGARFALPPGWPRGAIALGTLLVLVVALAGCGGPAASEDEGGWLVRYERVWTDGFTERQTIWPDGRVVMRHGETLERLTIDDEDVARIEAALGGEIPVGSPDDSPARTLTLGDGRVIEAPRPEPGSASELLERLLDRHSLEP